MARKYNVKHNRGASRYPQRLRARGESRTPVMRWTGLSTEAIAQGFKSSLERARTEALKQGNPLP